MRKRDRWKLAGLYLLIGLVASGVILFLLAEFHEEITEPFLSHLDRQVMQAVHSHASAPLTAFMLCCTFIGSVKVFLPATVLIAALLWWRNHRADALFLLIAIAGAAALNFGLKVHFRRLRPDVPWALAHEHTFSFPSGHSLFAMVLYGTVSYLVMTRLRSRGARAAVLLGGLAIVIAIGVSRVYLGVHYPTDVAAGYLVGLIWLAAVIGSDWNLRLRTHSD
jgi:membrane-associated phospholipid phosphatase